jgi:hypothetical protein
MLRSLARTAKSCEGGKSEIQTSAGSLVYFRDMKAGRWELRALEDGKLRLLWWADDSSEGAALDLTKAQAFDLANTLVTALGPDLPDLIWPATGKT